MRNIRIHTHIALLRVLTKRLNERISGPVSHKDNEPESQNTYNNGSLIPPSGGDANDSKNRISGCNYESDKMYVEVDVYQSKILLRTSWNQITRTIGELSHHD